MTQDSDRSLRSTRARSTGALVRGLALTAAFCIGGLATYAATAPSAFASTVAENFAGTPLMQHLHSHADMHAHFEQVLTGAGANDAQRQQIDAIFKEAMTAEHADMARYHATMGRMKTLLTASQIDSLAVERVRSDQDQLLLDTNRRITETLTRSARVLTPAQRQALGAEIDRLMAQQIGHHHGG
ncbi:hypothetical protein DWG18_07700 [Lysobacter sp. TY2-98]|uniref:Spy/CpxP family protein refolding chaperone n=1 Tax=Lysobacter sp. TY2-98 TaxID=2290922 RepID=UPI000E1FD931|nr:periplasmic heavy metal sensor [Lysobacter sp. TY2-98]AXK72178.1 hypothetical protein DWG18_07700 [Lysobacter sp. TY2-98]